MPRSGAFRSFIDFLINIRVDCSLKINNKKVSPIVIWVLFLIGVKYIWDTLFKVFLRWVIADAKNLISGNWSG